MNIRDMAVNVALMSNDIVKVERTLKDFAEKMENPEEATEFIVGVDALIAKMMNIVSKKITMLNAGSLNSRPNAKVVCGNCKQPKVQVAMWADVNTREILGPVDIDTRFWCDLCGEHIQTLEDEHLSELGREQ